MNRVKHERTEDLAREVLKDIGCLEHTTYQCAWLSDMQNAGPNVRVPGLILKFDYPEADKQPALAIAFANNGFATGSPLHDEKLRTVIRKKVEEYLKKIGLNAGFNTPQDMRLTEEYYV